MELILSILDVVWKIVFILFFFGFCIFIHEFGHMLAALWQGLYVERFSIGLGSPLWKLFTWRGVEFVISWIPFGGYVAIPQLDAADVEKAENEKSLKPCKPIPRAIVAFAGPFFNILFGFFLATVMWGVGVWEAPMATSCTIADIPRTLPDYSGKVKIMDEVVAFNGQDTDKYLEELLEDVEPGTEVDVTVLRGDKRLEFKMNTLSNPEWEAGLRKGDRIVAVNGKGFTKGREEFQTEYVYNGGYNMTLTAIRDGKPFDASYTPLPNPLMEGLGAPFFYVRNPIAVGGVHADSIAAKAGIQAGDQILQVNEINIINGRHFQEVIAKQAGMPFCLLVSRNGKELSIDGVSCPEPCTLQNFGVFFSVVAANVVKGLPAMKAGIKRGDRIVRIDDEDVIDGAQVTAYIRSTEGRPMNITVLRNGKLKEFKGVKAEMMEMDGSRRYLVGVNLDDSSPKVIAHPNPWRQFSKIMSQTWRTLKLLFTPITSKITGRQHGKATVKVEHMSGALGILTMMWYTLDSEGLRGGFALIILITFSLAVMNLLPIPALDGCYILFSLIEVIIRRRLPPKLVGILVQTFFYLLIFLIFYITFFDGRRIFRLFKFGSTKGAPVKIEEKAVPDAPLIEEKAPEKNEE